MSENWAIHIKTGQFEGVQYAYGKIGLTETKDGNATLKFNYVILDACDFAQDMLKCSTEFNNHVGDILVHILEDSLANEKFKIGNNERSNPTNGS